jgi:outer membrane immunogenic protein
MRTVLIAAAAAGVFASCAYAADLPTKAPTMAAPSALVTSQWTGFYVGVHGGAAWGSGITQSMNDTNGGGFDNPNFGGRQKLGAEGGVHLGYNWQVSPSWVVGLEADFSWTSLNNSDSRAPAFAGGGAVPATSISMSNNVRWLASARGRVGYTWDRTLVYLTGGAAWMNVSYSATLAALAPLKPTQVGCSAPAWNGSWREIGLYAGSTSTMVSPAQARLPSLPRHPAAAVAGL